jgi:hypothetical protein
MEDKSADEPKEFNQVHLPLGPANQLLNIPLN